MKSRRIILSLLVLGGICIVILILNAVMPSKSVQQKQSSPSKRMEAQLLNNAPSSRITQKKCTSLAWTCTEWTNCSDNRSRRTCEPSGLEMNCTDLDSVRPIQVQFCGLDFPLMKDNLKKWDALHNQMLAKESELSEESDSSNVIRKLNRIESEFFKKYDEYYKIYWIEIDGYTRQMVMAIEDRMRQLEEEFQKISRKNS